MRTKTFDIHGMGSAADGLSVEIDVTLPLENDAQYAVIMSNAL